MTCVGGAGGGGGARSKRLLTTALSAPLPQLDKLAHGMRAVARRMVAAQDGAKSASMAFRAESSESGLPGGAGDPKELLRKIALTAAGAGTTIVSPRRLLTSMSRTGAVLEGAGRTGATPRKK